MEQGITRSVVAATTCDIYAVCLVCINTRHAKRALMPNWVFPIEGMTAALVLSPTELYICLITNRRNLRLLTCWVPSMIIPSFSAQIVCLGHWSKAVMFRLKGILLQQARLICG